MSSEMLHVAIYDVNGQESKLSKLVKVLELLSSRDARYETIEVQVAI